MDFSVQGASAAGPEPQLESVAAGEKMICQVVWCAHTAVDCQLLCVPAKRLRTVAPSLQRDDAWTKMAVNAAKVVRVCSAHVADQTPSNFALHQRKDDPRWSEALAVRAGDAVNSLPPGSEGGRPAFHMEYVDVLAKRDAAAPRPRPSPKDRAEPPVTPSRLSTLQQLQKRFVVHFLNPPFLSVAGVALFFPRPHTMTRIQELTLEKDAAEARAAAAEAKCLGLQEQLDAIMRGVRTKATAARAADNVLVEELLASAQRPPGRLTMAWLETLGDKACRCLTGLPKKGLQWLLDICVRSGFDNIFPAPRVYNVTPGPKRRASAFDPSASPATPASTAGAAGAAGDGGRAAAPATPPGATTPGSGPVGSAETPGPTPTSAPFSLTPPLSISWQDALLMLLLRLKCDMGEEQLAVFFTTTNDNVSVHTTAMAGLLEMTLDGTVGSPRTVPDAARLHCFAKGTPFGNVTYVGDTTLIRTQKPKNHKLQRLLYSTYMPGHKFKALVCMGPDGYPNFISELYPSSYSDRQIATESGFLDTLGEGDTLMFDKGGMSMQQDADEKGFTLLMPSVVTNKFLRLGEWKWSRMVSSARVHIERVNERIKRYRWLDGVIPLSSCPTASTMFRLCALLTFFMGPLVKNGGRGLRHLGVGLGAAPPAPAAATAAAAAAAAAAATTTTAAAAASASASAVDEDMDEDIDEDIAADLSEDSASDEDLEEDGECSEDEDS